MDNFKQMSQLTKDLVLTFIIKDIILNIFTAIEVGLPHLSLSHYSQDSFQCRKKKRSNSIFHPLP